MSKVLVLYYSSYGHIETMAQAVAEGAREVGFKSTSDAFLADGELSRPGWRTVDARRAARQGRRRFYVVPGNTADRK
jgi:hypothetical protein